METISIQNEKLDNDLAIVKAHIAKSKMSLKVKEKGGIRFKKKLILLKHSSGQVEIQGY